MNKRTITLIVLALISTQVYSQSRVDTLIQHLNNSNENYIMVVAHRGDWRHAPENSLQAIQNCIDMGVDMVEIDVRKTKDGRFVLMHDDAIDRTTTGNGDISDWSFDDLKKLYLKDGIGAPTEHKIPALEEILELAKGKILVNLDKCYDHIHELYPMLKRTGTLNQVVFKGWMKNHKTAKSDFGPCFDEVHFMPIVNLNEPGYEEVIDSYSEANRPVAFEVLFEDDQQKYIPKLVNLRQAGSRLWINSLWPIYNGGHHDDRAVYDLEGSYGWLLSKGVNIIQTDRPKLLLDYLVSKDLH